MNWDAEAGAYRVLDHGLVRLVDHMGSDLSVVRAARVSYDAAWRAGEDEGKDAKLIGYLMKNRHTSPFEAVSFTFEVKAPIFVLRQWHRHRTWCLAGDTNLEFVRPADGKPYKVTVRALEKSWNPPKTKRRRRDQSPLNLEEHNRGRIQGMRLRCRGVDGTIDETSVLDVWQSGVKKVYEVRAGGRTIKASAEHRFFSQGAWCPLSDLSGRKVTLLHFSGDRRTQFTPEITDQDLLVERWAEFAPGYRVSSLGRVQSQWGQGARKRSEVWVDKVITVTSGGRAVVGLKGSATQVSKLVADAFIESSCDLPFVLHNDDNALNNRLSNLRRGTALSNAQDSIKNGSHSVRSWVEVPVDSIREVGEEPVFDISVAHPEHCFVANNFLVHNCFNEVSARYAELPEEFYVPELSQITTQSSSNKQMRTAERHPDAAGMREIIRHTSGRAFAVYSRLIAEGCPRELARSVLPVGAYSHMFATVDLHNLFHFLKLRLHSHAQYEIRVYAEAMLALIGPIVPACVSAFKEHML